MFDHAQKVTEVGEHGSAQNPIGVVDHVVDAALPLTFRVHRPVPGRGGCAAVHSHSGAAPAGGGMRCAEYDLNGEVGASRSASQRGWSSRSPRCSS